jgi:RNA recognition motif-containing protein
MPRFIFSDNTEFMSWVEVHVTPDKYECYVTDSGELLLSPTKSTRPMNYAYIKFASYDAAKETIEKLKSRVRIYRVTRIEYDPDRAVGVRIE